MKELIHGGDIYTDRKLPRDVKIIDFSANINPLGMPQAVKQAIIDSIEQSTSYPDPLCRALRRDIATHEGVLEEQIICGNGAADLIFRIATALKPKKALMIAPTFAEYELSLHTVECTVEHHLLFEKNGFRLDESILPKIKRGVDIVYLCNPNNPTGLPTPRELVLKIATRCQESGTVLVVDECFNDFLMCPQEYSVVTEFGQFDKMIILKAFTKMYAMAGVRLGYAICQSSKIIDALYAAGQPWSVSTIAQQCGIAALTQTEHAMKTRVLIGENRTTLIEELTRLGLAVFPSQVNFILFRTQDRKLSCKLERLGVLIRSCSNYQALDDRYFRVAVKSAAENSYLVHCLKKILK